MGKHRKQAGSTLFWQILIVGAILAGIWIFIRNGEQIARIFS